MKRILIAGIGNIFLGDDAFGSVVVQRLMQREWPRNVRVVDFGIRSYDLAYGIMDGYDVIVLVDATPRGEPPGTVSLIAPDLDNLQSPESELANAHNMNPLSVLQMVRSLGGLPGELYLVGCEPAVLETEDLGLSERVNAAVPRAIEMIDALLDRLLHDTRNAEADLSPSSEEVSLHASSSIPLSSPRSSDHRLKRPWELCCS